MTNSNMTFTCLVAAWNEAPRIGCVLEAISQVEAIERVIVVDDGSTDGTAKIARKRARMPVTPIEWARHSASFWLSSHAWVGEAAIARVLTSEAHEASGSGLVRAEIEAAFLAIEEDLGDRPGSTEFSVERHLRYQRRVNLEGLLRRPASSADGQRSCRLDRATRRPRVLPGNRLAGGSLFRCHAADHAVLLRSRCHCSSALGRRVSDAAGVGHKRTPIHAC